MIDMTDIECDETDCRGNTNGCCTKGEVELHLKPNLEVECKSIDLNMREQKEVVCLIEEIIYANLTQFTFFLLLGIIAGFMYVLNKRLTIILSIIFFGLIMAILIIGFGTLEVSIGIKWYNYIGSFLGGIFWNSFFKQGKWLGHKYKE